jgi:hypothetical protein
MKQIKYELTEKFIELSNGSKLYQIKALIEFANIKTNDLGGFIEKTENLDQSGNAWVYGDAVVYGDARVYGNAWEKSPLQIQGTSWFVNMATTKIMKIGCQEHELQYWVEHFEEISNRHTNDESIKAEYKLYIDLAVKLYTTKENCQ